MTKLAYLHEPGVLDNLRSRYDINEIYVCIPDANCSNFVSLVSYLSVFILIWHAYAEFCFQTYTGNILIAVNPFIKLPHLYDSHMMAQYKGAGFGELSPHPFAIADAAYRYILCRLN